MREGRVEECYCTRRDSCPANLVVSATNKDYSALIDPRVRDAETDIKAERWV